MASWQYEFVLSSSVTYLQNTNDSAKRAFLVRYEQVLFPNSGSSVGQTVRKTWRNITRVTLWGRDHFRNNIRLAMVKEALGLGPRYYGILRTSHPGFSERLFLLAQFLPHQKFYLYPHFGLPPRVLSIFQPILERLAQLSVNEFFLWRKDLTCVWLVIRAFAITCWKG